MVIKEEDFNKFGCPYCNYKKNESTMANGNPDISAFSERQCPECKGKFTLVVNPNDCILDYVETSLHDQVINHPNPIHFWR